MRRGGEFGFIFPQVGLCGADISITYLYGGAFGLGHASELLFFGDIIDADARSRSARQPRGARWRGVREAGGRVGAPAGAGPSVGARDDQADDRERAHDGARRTRSRREAQAQALCMQHPDFGRGARAFKDNRRAPRVAGLRRSERRSVRRCSTMKLSTDDLPMMFGDAHVALASGCVTRHRSSRPSSSRGLAGGLRGRRSGA